MMIGMVLFWGAIVLGIVWLIRGASGFGNPGPEETALAILDRRFAEGALSLEDYRERRSVLTGAATLRPDQDTSSDKKERSER